MRFPPGALRRDGNLTLVGAPDQPHAVSAFGLIFGNKSLSGSLIGVNAAGGTVPPSPLERLKIEDWDRTIGEFAAAPRQRTR